MRSFFLFTIFLAYCASSSPICHFRTGTCLLATFLSTSHEVVWYHYFVVYMSSLTPPPPITRPLPRHCYTSPHLQPTNLQFSLFLFRLGQSTSHVPSCFVLHAFSSPPCPRRSWIRRHHRIYKLYFFVGWRAYVEIAESGARSMAACSAG
jgi:hypothetical protein